ncbi:integrase/recombinase xerD homolog [Paroedura picta]|uniref:integrase/recombinase xerD homolog n=1 Tax=Paroedura picta TaxID=143630 RepID=UPI004055FCBF
MGSLAPATIRAYTSAVTGYLQFSSSAGCTYPFPMTEEMVLKYLAFLHARGSAPRTLSVHLAGLSFFCKTNSWWDPASSFLARKAVLGWKRAAPQRQDVRRPISMRVLQGLLGVLPIVCTSGFECKLFAAAFTLTFFGAFRCSEVVAASKTGSGARALDRQDVCIIDEELHINLRRSKTDQLGKGSQIILTRANGSLPCPVRCMEEYLEIRPGRDGPLLIHLDGQYLSRFQFMAVLRVALKKLGLPEGQYGTHSFRIGAATQEAEKGSLPERVKAVGRWRSEAYRQYVRPDLLL